MVWKGYVWILGKRKPSSKPGGLALQEREKAGSWLQTVEEDRHSEMAKDTGDGLATSSGDVYAHSECYCAMCSIITITGIAFYYIICFRKINHLVPNTICIHPLMYRKLCRAQLL